MTTPFLCGQRPSQAQMLQLPNQVGQQLIGSSGTTTSATYVAMPGTPSITISKKLGGGVTFLQVEAWISLFATVGNTVVDFQLLFAGGSGLTVAGGYMNVANTSRCWSISVVSATSFAAGSYAVTLLWRRVSGTGTLSQDGSTALSWAVSEVYS